MSASVAAKTQLISREIAVAETGAEQQDEQAAMHLAEFLATLSTQAHSGIDFSQANQAYRLVLTILPTASTYVAYGNYLFDAKQYSQTAIELVNAVHLKAMGTRNFHSALEGLSNIVVAGLSDGYEHLTVTAGEDLNLYARPQ